MDRSKYLLKLFNENGHTTESIAKILGIKRNSLYKKTTGINKFSESDCKKIMKALKMSFDDIFNYGKLKKDMISRNYPGEFEDEEDIFNCSYNKDTKLFCISYQTRNIYFMISELRKQNDNYYIKEIVDFLPERFVIAVTLDKDKKNADIRFFKEIQGI